VLIRRIQDSFEYNSLLNKKEEESIEDKSIYGEIYTCTIQHMFNF
jgi:hypothetical protein